MYIYVCGWVFGVRKDTGWRRSGGSHGCSAYLVHNLKKSFLILSRGGAVHTEGEVRTDHNVSPEALVVVVEERE